MDSSLTSLLLKQEQIIEELTDLNKQLTEVLAQYIEIEEEESKQALPLFQGVLYFERLFKYHKYSEGLWNYEGEKDNEILI